MSRENLKIVGTVLGWSALIGMGVATLWFVLFLLPGGWFCRVQYEKFSLTARECALGTVAGIGILKVLVWVFALAPWIAIQITLRKWVRE